MKYLLYFMYKLQELKLFFKVFFYEICSVYGVFWPSICINTQLGVVFQIILTDTQANSAIVFVVVLVTVIPTLLCYLLRLLCVILLCGKAFLYFRSSQLPFH